MTDADRMLLDFADRWWQRAGNQHDAIQDELGLTPTRYWQRLNNLLNDPEAEAYRPALVRRLRRVRSAREVGRLARRV